MTQWVVLHSRAVLPSAVIVPEAVADSHGAVADSRGAVADSGVHPGPAVYVPLGRCVLVRRTLYCQPNTRCIWPHLLLRDGARPCRGKASFKSRLTLSEWCLTASDTSCDDFPQAADIISLAMSPQLGSVSVPESVGGVVKLGLQAMFRLAAKL